MKASMSWSVLIASVVVAVATQQVIISRSTNPAVDSHAHQTRKKIDTAELTVKRADVTNNGITVQILTVSSECYKCAYYGVGSIDKHHDNKTIVVDTRWPLTVMLSYNEVNCSLTHHFGEHGEYVITVVMNATSSCTVHGPEVTLKPTNSNIPILVAFVIFLVFGICYTVGMKLRDRHLTSHSAELQSAAELVTADLGTLSSLNTSYQKSNLPSRPRERLVSIDTFRGLCIVIMIFVNYRGGYYWFFHHSKWNGLTVADLVFPWFMFIMGINITLSVDSLLQKETPKLQILYKAVRRTIILFALGAFIINHNTSWSTFRIPGVLQRFAIAYLVAFMLQWAFHKSTAEMDQEPEGENVPWWFHFRDVIYYWSQWLVILSLEALWLLLTFLLPVPGCPTGYMGPGGLADDAAYNRTCIGGAAGYIDRWLFGEAHIYGHPTCKNLYYPMLGDDEKVPFDPEGVLGSINGCVIVLLGCQAGKIFLYYRTPRSRSIRWMSWCVVLGVISAILCQASANNGWIPVNKNLWTTTFVTTLSSMAFFLITVIYCLVDVTKVWSGSPFDFVGMNSILLYVGHETFGDYVPFSWGLTSHASHAEWLAMNVLAVGYWVLIAYYCYRVKFFLKI